MEILSFGSEDLRNVLSQEPERAEELPFGAILLDRNGIVLRYNKAEGLLSGRNPVDVIGSSFFDDIAPCAKGQNFHNEFTRFVETGEINVLMTYEFTFDGEKVAVRIHMRATPDHQTCWVFIKRVAQIN